MKTEKLQLEIIVDKLESTIGHAEKIFGIGPFPHWVVEEAGGRTCRHGGLEQ